MRYFSMFSGIGTGEKGIEQAFSHQGQREQSRTQWQHERNDVHIESINAPICVGFSEIDRHAEAIYRYHYPEHRNYGDATRIVWRDVPDFDLLIAGTPCQSWSIAGKRGGFNDFRGTLWFECFKALREKRPKFFLFENVAGLLSHDAGRSMERICEALCECGYAIDFDLLNSKDFGVPQNRNRVFIIGIRLDLLDNCQLF